MNSFTKPPSPSRKFQFDVDFDAEDERHRAESHTHDETHAAEEAVHVPTPEFFEEDLTQARSEAFQAGFDAGLDEAKKAIENALNSTINSLIINLQGLVDSEEAREKAAKEVALRTSIATIKKIWPQILKKLGQDSVEATLRQSMEYNPEESRIVVRVHDTMLDTVVQHLPQIQAQQAFAGKVIIIADTGIQPGDCKIEWADGGLERLSRTLSANIEDALERILTHLSNPTHQ